MMMKFYGTNNYGSLNQMKKSEQIKIAKKVKEACIEAAREGFKDASMSGLCHDGAIEAAISAIQRLDPEKIICK